MFDQASELRSLALRAVRDAARPGGSAPRIVVFSGGKGGVGVTTLAINIAVTMVGHGIRVVLVDADLYHADVAPLCGLPERGDVGDILTARRDIHEVLERGPGGILVVPGVWAPEHEIPFSRHAQHRLIRQIRALGRHADLVVIDLGNATADKVHWFWLGADEVVLVATPEPVAVMDGYATVKTAIGNGVSPETLSLVVNQASAPRRGLWCTVGWISRCAGSWAARSPPWAACWRTRVSGTRRGNPCRWSWPRRRVRPAARWKRSRPRWSACRPSEPTRPRERPAMPGYTARAGKLSQPNQFEST